MSVEAWMTSRFDWPDPFHSEDQLADPAFFFEMGDFGLPGATAPAEYGGAGLRCVSHGVIACEIERVDGGYRAMRPSQAARRRHD
jgi:glutaryl-CoA dehydrogenase